jgi:hypothetical protein
MMQKRLEVISVVLSYFAIGSLLFLAIGLSLIDNYINWGQFAMAMLFSGLLFGAFLFYLFSSFIPAAKTYKNPKGVGLLAPLAFAFSLLFFGVGTLLNQSFHKEVECKTYTIQRMGESGSKTKAYYIFIDNGNRVERLSFGKAFNQRHSVGDKVNLCIITGGLGFKFYKVNSSA